MLVRLVMLVGVLCGWYAWGLPLGDNEIGGGGGGGLRGRGQPELVQSLALPTDEESFNRLSLFQYSPASGTHHFVSSTFPEIDARGFHESVFDAIGDYYPIWPKRLSFRSGSATKTGLLKSVLPGLGSVRQKRDLKVSLGDGKEIAIAEKKVNESQGVAKGIGEDVALSVARAIGDEHRAIEKRSGRRHVRGMEMGSAGFHGDTFHSGFGDFVTMRRRRRTDALKKRNANSELLAKIVFDLKGKHAAHEAAAAAKRRPEMDSMGFHGDTFGGGFGDFETMKRDGDVEDVGRRLLARLAEEKQAMSKRRPEMDSMGFHGDTFGSGFGEFETMRKRRPEMDSMGFHGDTFGGGFGDFETMKKRRPEMDSMGFHGDTFGSGFGDFETMKSGGRKWIRWDFMGTPSEEVLEILKL